MNGIRSFLNLSKYELIREILYGIAFGLLATLFSLVQLKIRNYSNAFTDLREIPLLIGIFYLRTPFTIIFLCLLSPIAQLFTDPEIYWPTVVMHILPLYMIWFAYQWIKTKEFNNWTFGIIWMLITYCYYLVILPILIITYEVFGLGNEYSFLANFIDVIKSTKFEIAATSLVTSTYLVQLKVRVSLEQSRLQLKKSNNSLIQTNKDLDNFIYTASHELKAPIANIEGGIRLLNSDQVTIEEIRVMHTMMLTSISKFKETVETLTEIAKVQQLREDNYVPIDLQKLVDQIILSFKVELKKIEPKINIDFSKCPIISFPEKSMIRILENLISNSIQYRDSNRELEISINSFNERDYNIISITDNGIGIKKSYHDKVFSMFRKAQNEKNSIGIGLYIVKRIIENEGGKVELKSKEGFGSTFKIFFKDIDQNNIM